MTRKPAGKPGGLGIKKMTTKVRVVVHSAVGALQGVRTALWASTSHGRLHPSAAGWPNGACTNAVCRLQVDDSLFHQKPQEAPPPVPVGVSAAAQEADKPGAPANIDSPQARI